MSTDAWFREYERQEAMRDERLDMIRAEMQRRRAPKCEDCGINPADPPSKLCPGCEAFREHQR
jgi:rubrerythrin